MYRVNLQASLFIAASPTPGCPVRAGAGRARPGLDSAAGFVCVKMQMRCKNSCKLKLQLQDKKKKITQTNLGHIVRKLDFLLPPKDQTIR